MLGKQVTVTIDRPLGSIHPEDKEIVYPINYGYIEGIISPIDEEWIDAYVLGVDVPIKSFTGVVIAIIRREADEEKLVVANENYTEEEILKSVYFMERFFKSKIEVWRGSL